MLLPQLSVASDASIAKEHFIFACVFSCIYIHTNVGAYVNRYATEHKICWQEKEELQQQLSDVLETAWRVALKQMH